MKELKQQSLAFIDPICFEPIDAGKKDFLFTHRMRTYYFCTEGCRKAFMNNPEKYLNIISPKHKGWLSRYLERLKRGATDHLKAVDQRSDK